jgi:uncharacterized LabA/DUF88 family protein
MNKVIHHTITTVEKKIFVFIDAENIRNSLEAYGYIDLDYEKLYKWLTNILRVKRVYLYAGIERGDVAKEQMLNKLQAIGYFVTKKIVSIYTQPPFIVNVPCNKCGNIIPKTIYRHSKQKANCDTELTLDVINCGVRKKYDEIIVFSGDGDFSRVYEYVAVQLGKKVTVYSPFDTRTSSKVKEMDKTGVIKLEDLRGLFQHYAKK